MKLKPFVFPFLYCSLIFTLIVGLYFTSKIINNSMKESMEDVTYVSKIILEDVIPVADFQTVVGNPYLSDQVKIGRYYYNLEDDIDRQKESIIYYDNTYMPNTGIDYISDESFEVVAIIDGTIVDIKEDEMLGKIVELRHDDWIITYAGLQEISVQKGEKVSLGMKLGMSGTNKINESLGNHLHLEIIKGGENIDPLKIIGKNLDEFKGE